jgi:hypothetical protein
MTDALFVGKNLDNRSDLRLAMEDVANTVEYMLECVTIGFRAINSAVEWPPYKW